MLVARIIVRLVDAAAKPVTPGNLVVWDSRIIIQGELREQGLLRLVGSLDRKSVV